MAGLLRGPAQQFGVAEYHRPHRVRGIRGGTACQVVQLSDFVAEVARDRVRSRLMATGLQRLQARAGCGGTVGRVLAAGTRRDRLAPGEDVGVGGDWADACAFLQEQPGQPAVRFEGGVQGQRKLVAAPCVALLDLSQMGT